MPAYDPLQIPVDAFYSHTVKDPLPTTFSGAIGVTRYPQTGYQFGTAAQSYYLTPPPSYNPSPYPSPPHHPPSQRAQHAAYDPSYSPSSFVQPSLNSNSYGPARARSNSIHKHCLTSPYKTGTRARCQSTVQPVTPEPSRSSKTSRGSKHIGPCLPDGPADHIRVPQEAYQEPVMEPGYQRLDHHCLQPIVFKNRRSATPGMRISEVDGEYCPTLEGGSDRIFEGFAYREVKIRILWPGYPPFEKRIRTQDNHRSMLLMLVAAAVEQSMKGHAGKMVPPKRGFESWAIGKNGLRPDDVLITGLEHRGGANFQVEIYVPRRKMGM
ncbi:Peroxysomal citrate synthase [Mycena sanguinolenta]|uniref:Peroxysomal citrate synthase n=1 Tax=Mycena sanguinolenta TaxID=230812 RepID=A0A8H6ZEF2_9AGAR|nr:Peroxysomal citrate synthase [Mycena sanguinolenta]